MTSCGSVPGVGAPEGDGPREEHEALSPVEVREELGVEEERGRRQHGRVGGHQHAVRGRLAVKHREAVIRRGAPPSPVGGSRAAAAETGEVGESNVPSHGYACARSRLVV